MSITLKGTVDYTFINTYMHTAKNFDKNVARYEDLTKTYKMYKNKGPTFIGGDFNARLQGKEDQGDNEKLIGNNLFNPESLREQLDTGVNENKCQFVEFIQKLYRKAASAAHVRMQARCCLRT